MLRCLLSLQIIRSKTKHSHNIFILISGKFSHKKYGFCDIVESIHGLFRFTSGLVSRCLAQSGAGFIDALSKYNSYDNIAEAPN